MMNVHFNSYKVKYVKMNSFFRQVKNTYNVKTLNIFINIDDLFHMLHRPLINNEFQVCGANVGKQLMSNIFNLMGHYRNWAIKEGFDVKVYGIYTTNIRTFKNNMYTLDYRKKFRENNDDANTKYYFINEAIKSCSNLFPVISGYIPGVYLIDSKYIEPSVVPLYIANEVNNADWNILISRDTYDLQYAYKHKWSYISPKGDNSSNITMKNMWNYLNKKERIYKEEVDLFYDHTLYPLAKTIVGDTYRNIPRLRKIGWKTLFSYLDKVSSDVDQTNQIIIQNRLLELLQNKKISEEDFNNNAYCIDIEKQLETMMEIDKSVILTQLKDVPDYENLKMLNSKYFYGCPINLEFLCNSMVNKNPWKK